jgi:hypothetical protein
MRKKTSGNPIHAQSLELRMYEKYRHIWPASSIHARFRVYVRSGSIPRRPFTYFPRIFWIGALWRGAHRAPFKSQIRKSEFAETIWRGERKGLCTNKTKTAVPPSRGPMLIRGSKYFTRYRQRREDQNVPILKCSATSRRNPTTPIRLLQA